MIELLYEGVDIACTSEILNADKITFFKIDIVVIVISLDDIEVDDFVADGQESGWKVSGKCEEDLVILLLDVVLGEDGNALEVVDERAGEEVD